jgi:hypothetical protein
MFDVVAQAIVSPVFASLTFHMGHVRRTYLSDESFGCVDLGKSFLNLFLA